MILARLPGQLLYTGPSSDFFTCLKLLYDRACVAPVGLNAQLVFASRRIVVEQIGIRKQVTRGNRKEGVADTGWDSHAAAVT